MLKTSFESVQGKRLRLARLGDGPPILFVHGYPDNLQIWCELAPRLADRYTVLALDWPGTGESEEWPGGATPMHLADRLLALLDSWQMERATLVGLDMGGQPVLVFAAKYPQRIRQLVVMNSLVLWDEKTSWEIRILRRFGWNRFILRHFPGIVFRRAERTFLPHGLRLPPDLRQDLWQSFRQASVRRFIAKMCAGYQGTLPRLPDLYARIRCPTLVLWGEHDRHFPPAHAQRLHALVPDSELQIVPGGEHWMPWYRAEEIAERVGSFLKRTA
jgi:pimeloyl-ACP methyl ester carboxylesterase